jgi:hypothetical protein
MWVHAGIQDAHRKKPLGRAGRNLLSSQMKRFNISCLWTPIVRMRRWRNSGLVFAFKKTWTRPPWMASQSPLTSPSRNPHDEQVKEDVILLE